MNKDKIREIRDRGVEGIDPTSGVGIVEIPSRVERAICDALLEEDDRVPIAEETYEYMNRGPKQPSLLPCPACGGPASWYGSRPDRFPCCTGCGTQGPTDDSTGEKWNHLARFTDTDYKIASDGREEGRKQERQRWIDALDAEHPIESSGRVALRNIKRKMGVTDD